MPTAFTASHGKGEPVIVILAALDALPGISQDGAAVFSGCLAVVAGLAAVSISFAMVPVLSRLGGT